jgi:hypothetical protein
MSLSLNKYSVIGRALTASEVDSNWTAIETILNAAMEAEEGGVTLAAVAPTADGSGLQFLASDGSTIGTVPLPSPFTALGPWQSGMDYSLRHVVTYDGSAWICVTPHTSGSSFETDAGLGKWILLAEGVSNSADNVEFDNTASEMDAETVQEAIEELHAALEAIPDDSADISDLKDRVAALESTVASWTDSDDQTATEVTYDNSASGLTATTTQAAIDELLARIEALEPA